MTFREYCLQSMKEDTEFDAIIGDVDMPATFGWCDDMVFTPYCEQRYGELLDSEIIIHSDPTGRYTDTVEVLYNNEKVGESFTYAVAGYIGDSEWNRLFSAKGE